MLGYKRALAAKQAELEKQVSGLKNSVALIGQENKAAVEGLSKELRTEIEALRGYFRTLDDSLKAQMSAVTKVTEAFGRSSDLEAINLLEMFQSFADRLNHIEEAVNHFTVTVYDGPAANPASAETIPPAVAENAPETPSRDSHAPKRGRRGRPRKSESFSPAHHPGHSAAEA